MGLAYGTIVATPGGEAAIERIANGDRMLAGSGQGEALSWSSARVAYSQGVAETYSRMSYLGFEDGATLVCTPDQPLLRADNRMVRAARLIPGDLLLAPDGTSRTLTRHAVGTWTGGLHAIAFAGSWNGRPDGHLISAAGLVAGDYVVQLHLEGGG